MVRATSYSVLFTVGQQIVALRFITSQIFFDPATFCEARKAFCAALRATEAHFSFSPYTLEGLDNHLALVFAATGYIDGQ